MLRWSQRARADLKAIHDRIAPEVGDPDVREVPVHSWRLIYQVRGDDVFVLAIVHKRRRSASDPWPG